MGRGTLTPPSGIKRAILIKIMAIVWCIELSYAQCPTGTTGFNCVACP